MHRVTALLSWFDESPEVLYESVTRASSFISKLICLDGPYKDYPYDKPFSDIDQYRAIYEACRNSGIQYSIGATKVWDTEMEKRTHLFHLGYQWGNCEWFYVLDADEFVISTGDIESHLDSTSLNVCTVNFYDSYDNVNLSESVLLDPIIARLYSVPSLTPRFFRYDEIRVIGNHHTYCASDGSILWGKNAVAFCVTAVVVQHRRDLRKDNRLNKQQGYYNRREQLGLEDD